jgi:hypothetical protein
MLELLRLDDTNIYHDEVDLTSPKLYKSELESGVKSFKYTMPNAPPHDCQLKQGVQMPPKYLPPNVSRPSNFIFEIIVYGARGKITLEDHQHLYLDFGRSPEKIRRKKWRVPQTKRQ